MSWHDAVEFCQRLAKHSGRKYRLPIEAEWEYACRAGTTTHFCFGEALTSELANFRRNIGKTTEVGSFPANGFGLYDVPGNVYEWCQDHWHGDYRGAPIDGRAWLEDVNIVRRMLGDSVRLVRGGSWVSIPLNCRSACRYNYTPSSRHFDIGFRVVCSAPRNPL